MRSLRSRAVLLRQRGWSYNVIAQRLGVGKSTLSHWLRTIPYTPNRAVIRRIRLGPARAAESKQRVKLQQIDTLRVQGRKELGILSKRDLWLLGLGLYAGEGTKLYEDVRLINSDPHIIRLAMRWFRKTCGVPDQNFSAVIHLYPDTSQQAALNYWSGITRIPRRQFEKIQVDRRQDKSPRKRRQLPYGTLHIKVYSRGDRRFGVALHRRIMGWIEAAYEDVRA